MKLIANYKKEVKPRLSIEEFERCRIEGYLEFELLTIFFAEENYPHRILGRVNDLSEWVDVVWNEYGEASIEGIRMREYDLISQSKAHGKNIAYEEYILVGTVIIGTLLIFYLILTK
jgi:hypothetical protein